MALPPLLEEDGVSPGELAVDVPGELTERLGALAQETGLWLIPGSVYERVGEGVANTAVVLSPAGELVASYRKCFPWQPYETTQPGTSTVCFDIAGVGRFGLAICHDGAFPEIFRSLAWQGAEAIFQVTLTGTSDRDAETVIARANAIVNQVAVVNVNAAAPVGNGRSLVIDPEGAVRYEAGVGEEVVTAVLDLDQVERVRERGSFGINRLWEEMDRVGPGLDLPLYGGPTGRGRGRARAPLPAGARGRAAPLVPVVSTAAQSEQSTASSVASTTAWKSGSSSRSGNERPPEVAKATKISPLPWCATEPARASPRPARRASRSSCGGVRGASVATTAMQLPPGAGVSSGRSSSSCPIGTPSRRNCSLEPKFVRRSTPTVWSPASRLDEPIPPFQPKQLIPAPAPTEPCSKSAFASLTARATSAGWTCGKRASESQLSSHSPTTGITTSSTPTRESAAMATETAPS